MAAYDKVWRNMTTQPKTKVEFYQIAGITPELEEFVDEFIKRPELLKSLPIEEQHQVEAKMNSIIAFFASSLDIDFALRKRRKL